MRSLGQEEIWTQKENRVKTQEKDGHLQAKERDLQNCENINFCCLSYIVCCTFLQQHQLTNTISDDSLSPINQVRTPATWSPSQVLSPLVPGALCFSQYGPVLAVLQACPAHTYDCATVSPGLAQSHSSPLYSPFPEAAGADLVSQMWPSPLTSSPLSDQPLRMTLTWNFHLNLNLAWLLVILFGPLLPSCSADLGAIHTQNSSPNFKHFITLN